LPTIYNIQHKSKQGIIATIPLTNKRLVNFFEKLEFIQTEVSHRNKEIDQWTKQFNNMNAESIESDFIFIKSK